MCFLVLENISYHVAPIRLSKEIFLNEKSLILKNIALPVGVFTILIVSYLLLLLETNEPIRRTMDWVNNLNYGVMFCVLAFQGASFLIFLIFKYYPKASKFYSYPMNWLRFLLAQVAPNIDLVMNQVLAFDRVDQQLTGRQEEPIDVLSSVNLGVRKFEIKSFEISINPVKLRPKLILRGPGSFSTGMKSA